MTKVQAKDIKNKAFLTTGTAPDYVVTVPREPNYADMDRVEILVSFHSLGTGAITLNMNGLGAKATGLTDVDADSYYTLIYDLSKDAFEVVGGGSGSGTQGSIISGSDHEIYSKAGTGSVGAENTIFERRSNVAGNLRVYFSCSSSPADIVRVYVNSMVVATGGGTFGDIDFAISAGDEIKVTEEHSSGTTVTATLQFSYSYNTFSETL